MKTLNKSRQHMIDSSKLPHLHRQNTPRDNYNDHTKGSKERRVARQSGQKGKIRLY